MISSMAEVLRFLRDGGARGGCFRLPRDMMLRFSGGAAGDVREVLAGFVWKWMVGGAYLTGLGNFGPTT